VAALALALAAGPACAQAVKPHGDETYTPQPGQPGKDVMWLGTPEAMVSAMLRAAKVGPGDFVADLGAGDGRIAIAAAKEFGARSMGIEYEPKMAALAQRNAAREGVADRVTIVHGDIFKEDFSRASVVTLYLLPELNLQLRPQILAMKPGTRVVSYTFTMGEWEPDETIKGQTFDAFRWTVPANVAGRWTLTDEQKRVMGTVDVVQRFQTIAGTITLANGVQPILGAFVDGTELGFSYVEPDGAFRAMRLRVEGDRAAGTSNLDQSGYTVAARRD
jgi:SAM-dependent methyltransferase